MDRDQKLTMFMESLGEGVDVDFAQSVLIAHDWDLQAALITLHADMGGAGGVAPPRQDVLDPEGYRAPMRTGYTDTLMGLDPPEERRRRAADRRRHEEELQAQAEVRRLAAEQAKHEVQAKQVQEQRLDAERSAQERRRNKLREEQMRQRQASAAVAAQEQHVHVRGKEPELLEAHPQHQQGEAVHQYMDVEQKRRQEEALQLEQASEEMQREKETQRLRKEAADLQREKDEAELRRREGESSSAPPKEADGVVQALVALRRRYKDTDPDGLAICLQTLRAYINNLARNPHEPKFQRINCDNNAFRTRIGAFEGAIAVLLACGFIEEGGALAVEPTFTKTKGSKLWDALTKLDVILQQVKAGA